jgi:acylphosphatase
MSLPRILLATMTVLASCLFSGCGKAGAKSPGNDASDEGDLWVDVPGHKVTLKAAVAAQNTYAQLNGRIEFALVATGGKDYETVLVTPAAPPDLYAALKKIGLRGGKAATDADPPKGQPVQVFVEWTDHGQTVRRPLDDLIYHIPTDKPMTPMPWVFTGSAPTMDPATNQASREAYLSKTIIGLHPSDRSPFFQNPRMESREGNIYGVNAALLPPTGTPVKVIFERLVPKLAPSIRRVHLLVSGRVQGLGFDEYTERQGRLLDLTGFVRNLPDERLEILAEGPTDRVEQLVEAVKIGPLPAREVKVRIEEAPPEGDFDRFDQE